MTTPSQGPSPPPSPIRAPFLLPKLSAYACSVCSVIFISATPVTVCAIHQSAVDSPRLVSKTGRERGREFRARRKATHQALEDRVKTLRAEIAHLDCQHRLMLERTVNLRHALTGSLVHIVRGYFSLFRFGLHIPKHVMGYKSSCDSMGEVGGSAGSSADCEVQLAFLNATMADGVSVGEKHGREAIEEIWRVQTDAHTSLRVENVNIDVLGGEEDPILIAYSKCYVRFSRDTFAIIFPHIQRNKHVVQKLIGQTATYHVRTRFEFTPENRIARVDGEVDFVQALLSTGIAIEEVTQMMASANIQEKFMIERSTDVDMDHHQRAATDTGSSGASGHEGGALSKMQLSFLLSE